MSNDEIDYSIIPKSRISLRPDFNSTNSITNELFQVTNRLRKQKQQKPSPKRLNNDKVWRMMNELKQSQLEDSNFELDDVLRTRVFKGRFKSNKSDLIRSDLNDYFDKENEPKMNSKKRKKNSSTTALRPITNTSFVRPKPMLKPLRSSFKKRECNFFLIESSTGLINDATKYATELNGSNSEEFPLPEHENEVVQIPTNDKDSTSDMAIIRMFKCNVDKGENNGVEVKSQKTVKWMEDL